MEAADLIDFKRRRNWEAGEVVPGLQGGCGGGKATPTNSGWRKELEEYLVGNQTKDC